LRSTRIFSVLFYVMISNLLLTLAVFREKEFLMKRVVFICILFFAACSEREEAKIITACAKESDQGISMEYCVLSKGMEPSFELREGEEFFISFKVKNHTDKTYYFYPEFSHREENNFAVVFDAEGRRVGKPFRVLGINLIGMAGWEFVPGEEYSFVQSWTGTGKRTWEHGHFESVAMPALKPGEYTLAFKEKFTFKGQDGSPDLDLGEKAFRVNFTVLPFTGEYIID
jgi:hypothetical protein